MQTAIRPEALCANNDDESELQLAWRDHCLRMAHATEALARWCADLAMTNAYLDLAAEWIRRADGVQPGPVDLP
jgi:hypothetical protein